MDEMRQTDRTKYRLRIAAALRLGWQAPLLPIRDQMRQFNEIVEAKEGRANRRRALEVRLAATSPTGWQDKQSAVG